LWSKRGYPSLKPLSSWVADLEVRVEFIKSWIQKGPPHIFWMSGLFFPQAFLTGILQNFARKHRAPIDSVKFDTTIIDGEEPKTPPEEGCYIKYLFFLLSEDNFFSGVSFWRVAAGIINVTASKNCFLNNFILKSHLFGYARFLILRNQLPNQ